MRNTVKMFHWFMIVHQNINNMIISTYLDTISNRQCLRIDTKNYYEDIWRVHPTRY